MNQNLVNATGLVSPVEPQVFYNNLPGGSSFWEVTFDNNDETNVTGFYNDVFAARQVGAPEPYRYASY